MQRHIKHGDVLQLIMSSLLLNSNIINNMGAVKKLAACRCSPFPVLAVKTFLLVILVGLLICLYLNIILAQCCHKHDIPDFQ